MAREGEYSAHYSGDQQNIEESLRSQTSSELSVWVFTTTLGGRDFCPQLTHKEMWVEIQWLPQELTLAMGSFYYTRLLSKLFENYLRHRVSRNCLVILVNLCFSGFYDQVFWKNWSKTKAQRVLRMSGWEPPPKAMVHSGEPRAGIEADAKALRTRQNRARRESDSWEQRNETHKQKALLLRNSDSPFCCVLNPLPRARTPRY